MPFIVQCPYADCRKFMLLEDRVRGSSVKCLVCDRRIDIEPSASDEKLRTSGPAPTAGSGEAGLPIQAADRHQIAHCPNCASPLRLPPGHRGWVQCPRCEHTFAVPG
ncbi:MAG: zinc-ribbon domain-containing protein [Thermoguttaceae bacterium]|jgi:hypothetical protein|nr:zinc-ribbon domain-containing protein [Thermoguttaceae bacterium]